MRPSFFLTVLLILAAPAAVRSAAPEPGPVRGLPLTRTYTLEEVGNVPRGARLDFDPHGRVAVVHDDVYSVLNDTAWVDQLDRTRLGSVSLSRVLLAADGRRYYVGRGNWGRLEPSSQGLLTVVPLHGEERPAWTLSTAFSDVAVTSDGVYFGGPNGVVFAPASGGPPSYLESPGVSRVFSVGDRVFLASHSLPLREIAPGATALLDLPRTRLTGSAVEYAIAQDPHHTLVCTGDGRWFRFDGDTAVPWQAPGWEGVAGPVTAATGLSGGGVAVAIQGRGVYLLSAAGEMTWALTAPEYHRVSALASREPGILWAATEDAVLKVPFGSPLTTFGQKLGLPASWPNVMRWRGRLVASSRGRIYDALSSGPGAPAHFQLIPCDYGAGAWSTAAYGDHLVVGNTNGVYTFNGDGTLSQIAELTDVSQVVMPNERLCYAVGRMEIAVFQHDGTRWSEAAPRLPNVGFAPVVHVSASNALWIEHGSNRVSRISFDGGILRSRAIGALPWKESEWVNLGLVGDLAILSGASGKRIFLDERTLEPRTAPELEQLLNRSPHWLTRVFRDDAGVIWATHRQGVVRFRPSEGGYDMDAVSLDMLNDQFPILRLLPGGDVWFTGGRSLYHVTPGGLDREPPVLPAPVLLSVTDAETGDELLRAGYSSAAPLRLPFDRGNLVVSLFSGTYQWRRPPVFEYRLSTRDRWIPHPVGAPLRFTGLRDGLHQLEVRSVLVDGTRSGATLFRWEVAPPWHRTISAWVLFALMGILAFAGLGSWLNRRARRRSAVLERLVQDRTRELETAMARLNEETRNAATLAERNRLAGEIHDSLQQGLTGLMLQLDSTLKSSDMSDDARSRLSVARKMVSYTRHEVQHAVWDLETPLLKGAELDEALRKLVDLISPGAAPIDVEVSGTPRPIPGLQKHHLLRVAQEAVTNAVRHASAGQIVVRLRFDSESVTLEVEDNGIGFDVQTHLSDGAGHFGLRGMGERASRLAAALEIHSTPGQGSLVRVRLPLAEAALPVTP